MPQQAITPEEGAAGQGIPDQERSSAISDGDGFRVTAQQEELRVGTRVVDTGKGVRVHKQVVQQPYQVNKTLSHDAIDVVHIPVDKIVAIEQAPVNRYEGDTWVIPVLEEVLVVEKRIRIKEEIRITKHRYETNHTEMALLNREELIVERFDESMERGIDEETRSNDAT